MVIASKCIMSERIMGIKIKPKMILL
jgi:hypothetical protein